MNATTARPWGSNGTSGIPLNVTLHSWPVPPPEPESKAPPVDVDTTRHNLTNRIFSLNATGYVALDDDITEPGLTDVQTLMLAGIGTLLTLVFAVGGVLGLRLLWVRYKHGKCEDYAGVITREESSDPERGLDDHNELKSSESQFTAGTSDEPKLSPTVITPKSNGSVITMTLKNNRLIVETEETTDAIPSVRVDSQGSITTFVTNIGFPNPSAMVATDHGALIHTPPHEIQDEDRRSSHTGLSQSDLSMSSSGSQNQSYRYGNQVGYDVGAFGYSDIQGDQPPSRPSNSSSRELIRYSRSPSLMERNDSVCSASDINFCPRTDLIGSYRENSETRLSGNLEVIADTETEDSSNTKANGRDRPTSLPISTSSNKVTRCQELRQEQTPLEEVEKYPEPPKQKNS